MKRKFVSMLAMIMSFIIMATTLVGCNLVTKDIDRDMNQIVASVSIEEGVKNDITKRELVLAYINYSGYASAGSVQSETINQILDSLITNKILVQNAMKYFDNNQNAQDKWNLEKYLTTDEKVEALYSTRKAINDIMDGFDESKKEANTSETFIDEVRTVPTGAQNKDNTDKKAYIDKAFDISSTASRREAYNKTVALLKNNGLLGDGFNGTFESSSYYQNVLTSEYEAIILNNYNKALSKQIRQEYTFEKLSEEFLNRFNTQKNWSNQQFVDSLSSASLAEPILYSKYGEYGYVYNLLLGAGEEVEAKIKEIDENKSDKDRELERKDLLKDTKVKDLRASWILSGYDFDGTKFTGDYALAKEDSLEFKGTVVKGEGEDAKYSITNTKEFNLDDFVKMMEEYVYGEEQTPVTLSETEYSVFRKVNSNADIKDYDKKINELLFAFSTDPGSLNTYKGYAIKPAVETGDEEYVETFANAARELLIMGKSSYVMVASDFGYHVLFYSQVFNGNYSVVDAENPSLTAYLQSLYGEKNWTEELAKIVDNFEDYEDTDNYLYQLLKSVSSAKVTFTLNKNQNDLLNTSLYEKDHIVKFESRYADLLG